jgi:hypothetical protein
MATNLFGKLGEAPLPGEIFEAPYPPKTKAPDDAPPTVTYYRTVTSFLGRLTLLQGLPFAYLVPHEKLLPPESLKFFSIDPQWISALIGGAASVGHPETILFLLNKAMAGNFGVLEEARTRRFRDRGIEPPKNVDYGAPTYEFTGFLLRSSILQGWPGLEVRAFKVGGQRRIEDELAMLRLDRVAGDTLFAVVDGQIGTLEITQPPEGLHFEVEKTDAPNRVLKIKNLISTWRLAPVDGSAKFADEGLRKGEPVRVIFNLTLGG